MIRKTSWSNPGKERKKRKKGNKMKFLLGLMILLGTSVASGEPYGLILIDGITVVVPPAPVPVPSAPPVPPVPNFIVSQDTWDDDNIALIAQSLRLHKRGTINLLAVVQTGSDLHNRGTWMTSQLMRFYNVHVPIIFLPNTVRETPTYQLYWNPTWSTDGVLDDQRGRIPTLTQLIRNSSGNIRYVVGGHINVLSEFIRFHPGLAREKISSVHISSGWGVTYYKPETNLSISEEASRYTHFLWTHIPNSIKMFMYDLPENRETSWNYNLLNHNGPLYYLVRNGPYFANRGNKTHMGDFNALAHAVYGCADDFCTEQKITLQENEGMIRTRPQSNKNHFLIRFSMQVSNNTVITMFENLIRGL